MPPKLNRKRALFVLTKIDEILAWEKQKEEERDTRFVDLGRYLFAKAAQRKVPGPNPFCELKKTSPFPSTAIESMFEPPPVKCTCAPLKCTVWAVAGDPAITTKAAKTQKVASVFPRNWRRSGRERIPGKGAHTNKFEGFKAVYSLGLSLDGSAGRRGLAQQFRHNIPCGTQRGVDL